MAENTPSTPSQPVNLIPESDNHTAPEFETPSKRSPAETEIASKGKDLTSRALEFLSTASNETLGACGVALCASTYFVLGRVGLVLIGAVGGVLIHATWEGASSATGVGVTGARSNKRKEAGVEIAKRLLDWKESRTPSTDLEAEEDAAKATDFSEFQPKTGAALTALTDAVIRDYVKY